MEDPRCTAMKAIGKPGIPLFPGGCKPIWIGFGVHECWQGRGAGPGRCEEFEIAARAVQARRLCWECGRGGDVMCQFARVSRQFACRDAAVAFAIGVPTIGRTTRAVRERQTKCTPLPRPQDAGSLGRRFGGEDEKWQFTGGRQLCERGIKHFVHILARQHRARIGRRANIENQEPRRGRRDERATAPRQAAATCSGHPAARRPE